MTHAKEPDAPDETTDGGADAAVEAAPTPETTEEEKGRGRTRIDWARIVAYGILPTIAFVLAASAGVLKYVDTAVRDDQRAALSASDAATSTTMTMLSYTPDVVAHQLDAASNLLTGHFRSEYLATIHNVVIPGATQQQISAVTKVPAAAVVSASGHHAVVMLFLDQTVTVGADAPTRTLSSARATLDEVDGKWLISEFALS